MPTTDHYPIRYDHPGTGGDRPSPRETAFTCACGAELWEQIGQSATVGTPEEAMEQHQQDLALEAVGRRLNTEGWTCSDGFHEPGQYDTCGECAAAADDLARFLVKSELLDPEDVL